MGASTTHKHIFRRSLTATNINIGSITNNICSNKKSQVSMLLLMMLVSLLPSMPVSNSINREATGDTMNHCNCSMWDLPV